MDFNFEKRSVLLHKGRRAYFSSDYHLGVPTFEKSLEREKLIIRWLESIENDAQVIFLVGDIFDFWFEYRHTVPKGFVRILGKLAQLSDRGIELFIFTGNHDMWMFGYLTQELNAKIFRNPVHFSFTDYLGDSQQILIGHGDGLGPGDKTYKFLKKIFESPFFQLIFRLVHPDVGIWIAKNWSHSSKVTNAIKGEQQFLGEDREWLFQYCSEVEREQHFDYYIFGHRHLPLHLKVNNNSTYINLGEWITRQTYAVYDGSEVQLKTFS